MRERPILFSGPLVRAILEGRKTQTRRVVKPQPYRYHGLQPMWGTSPDGHAFGEPGLWREVGPDYPDGDSDDRRCPYGVPGDRLWVRETWWPAFERTANGSGVVYRADYLPPTLLDASIADQKTWRPSIFMPRTASRLLLEVTDVRVQRVQEISVEDCIAEGCSTTLREHDAGVDLRRQYAELWDSINGKRGFGWDVNPWCWCVTFRRLEAA